MRSNGRIDKGFSDRLELSERAFFVRAHQAAQSGNIRRQNCRKPPYHALAAQDASRGLGEIECSSSTNCGPMPGYAHFRNGSNSEV